MGPSHCYCIPQKQMILFSIQLKSILTFTRIIKTHLKIFCKMDSLSAVIASVLFLLCKILEKKRNYIWRDSFFYFNANENTNKFRKPLTIRFYEWTVLLLHSRRGQILPKFLILLYFFAKLHSNCSSAYFYLNIYIYIFNTRFRSIF